MSALPACPYCASPDLDTDPRGRVRCSSPPCLAVNSLAWGLGAGRLLLWDLRRADDPRLEPIAERAGYTRGVSPLGHDWWRAPVREVAL